MAPKRKKRKRRSRKYSRRRFQIAVTLLGAFTFALFVGAAFFTYHTLRFTALIDARIQGAATEHPAWVYARPFELRRGQRLSADELVALLNDLGYRERRSEADAPASFRMTPDGIEIRRPGPLRVPVYVRFEDKWVASLRGGGGELERVVFGAVPVTTLFGEDRRKKRWVPLEEIPPHVAGAFLATEDQRFFSHTGFDPLGIARALFTDLATGELRQGGSTLTQQLVKNYFLTPERTWKRKILEAYLAVILETRTSKEDILELYLNDVYLGQRGSFGINGVGQGARVFFGKNVSNLSVAEAALLAAVVRAPNRSSPFRYPERARERRDIVLSQMAREGLLTDAEAAEAKKKPLAVVPGTIDRGEAPYFIDVLRRELLENHDPRQLQSRGLVVQSTMDVYLQNAAQRAVVEGLEEIRRKLPKHRDALPEAALVALDPTNGDVLALIGARSYGMSQFNRAVDARRQPGSAFKPFVYLTAFENDHRLSPATTVVDEPTTFRQGGRRWTPKNYSRRFEGRVSYRRALALSLNVATARVGERVGFDRVVALWESMGMSSRLEPYPSLVLGAFELSPLELATAYAVLANGGRRVTPRFFETLRSADGTLLDERPVTAREVASPESTYLVTDMLESVLAFGTAREIRARGFKAPGRRQDGHDERYPGRLVRGLYPGSALHRLGGLRRQRAPGPVGLPGGASHLDAIHEGRRVRTRKGALLSPERDRFSGDRSRERQARSTKLPAAPKGGVSASRRPEGVVPAPLKRVEKEERT